jgi:hypothetical protein
MQNHSSLRICSHEEIDEGKKNADRQDLSRIALINLIKTTFHLEQFQSTTTLLLTSECL